MLPAKLRAQNALDHRLAATLPHGLDDEGRTESLADNLVATITADPKRVVGIRGFFERGDGHELTGEPGRRPRLHSAHSSAALAANSFGAFIGRVPDLGLTLGPSLEEMQFEQKLPIFRGGRAPNLDVVLGGQTHLVGVESKLTEYLAAESPRDWQDSYKRDTTRALLDGGWRDLLEALTGDEPPEFAHVDTAQLVKHALGLAKQRGSCTPRLVYVYWEPLNRDDIPEVRQHRAEVERLGEEVTASTVEFDHMPYDALWTRWAAHGPPWVRHHVEALEQRYTVAVP